MKIYGNFCCGFYRIENLEQMGVDGVFGMQLKEGHYKITVSADGYVEQIFDMDLKLTGLKGLNVVMEKVV